MFTWGRIDSGPVEIREILSSTIELYFCKRHVDVCVSREIYIPVPRRPFVDSLSTFARFSSRHCGKISHFRFKCCYVLSELFWSKTSTTTWLNPNLKARKAKRERRVIIQAMLATTEWVKCSNLSKNTAEPFYWKPPFWMRFHVVAFSNK